MNCLQILFFIFIFVSLNMSGEKPTHSHNIEMSILEDETNLQLSNGKTGAQLGFLVRIGSSCTGTLIHPDWVITAVHCLKIDDEITMDKNGDKIVNLTNSNDPELTIKKPVGGTRIPEDQLWVQPVRLKKKKGEDEGISVWRKVEMAVMHPGFKGEALSWEGNDIALLKLNSETITEIEGNIVPICLPSEMENIEDMDAKLFVAGYGRRVLPHCMTNQAGPEKFGICGRPKECTKVHRARKCGLEFLYEGKLHHNCIHQETPSSNDPICMKLMQSLSQTSILTTTHVLSDTGDTILTTCYPTIPANNSKGWCTVRDPMHDHNTEPEYDNGWGFCSEDHDQKRCNDVVIDEIDLESFPVSKLSKQYCLDQLMLNLNIEQPDVKLETVEPFPKQFCTGRNISVENKNELFFQTISVGKFQRIDFTHKIRNLLLKRRPQYAQTIDGGPACFGDSGGPAFKLVGSVPVLEGVYSYMLWGTCRGRHEPSYYGRVSNFLDWIYKHIPRQEVCKLGKDGKIVEE